VRTWKFLIFNYFIFPIHADASCVLAASARVRMDTIYFFNLKKIKFPHSCGLELRPHGRKKKKDFFFFFSYLCGRELRPCGPKQTEFLISMSWAKTHILWLFPFFPLVAL
jgi:hypothetical protein